MFVKYLICDRYNAKGLSVILSHLKVFYTHILIKKLRLKESNLIVPNHN